MTGEGTSASFRRDARTTADGDDHRGMWLSQPASQGAQSGARSAPDKGLGEASGRLQAGSDMQLRLLTVREQGAR